MLSSMKTDPPLKSGARQGLRVTPKNGSSTAFRGSASTPIPTGGEALGRSPLRPSQLPSLFLGGVSGISSRLLYAIDRFGSNVTRFGRDRISSFA